MFRIKKHELIVLVICCYFLVNYQLYLSQVKREQMKEQIGELRQTETTEEMLKREEEKLFNHSSDFVHDESILNFTPMNILQLPRLQYLQEVKNPCLFVHNTKSKRKLVCFPYFVLAGFPKCGTSDLFNRLTKHPHFIKTSVKEPDYWDNLNSLMFETLPDEKLGLYSRYLTNLTQIVENNCINGFGKHIKHQCPYISGDFSTWTAFDGHYWQRESLNANLDEPQILIPHKLFHLNPNLKVIFMLRNPVDAVFSNYRFNMRENGSETDFHQKVVDAIDWWEKCTSVLSARRCAYGLEYPPAVGSLNPLGPFRGTGEAFPRDLFWKYTSIDRLRIYIYHIFIKDWLSVFPHKNILYISFESFAADPFKVIAHDVLPFLDLDQPTNGTVNAMKELDVDNEGVNNFQMLNITRGVLEKFFNPHVEKLSNLLKTDIFKW